MHLRSQRSLFAVALAAGFALTLSAEASAAGPKEKDAQKLFNQAMDEDYLATEFAKAEKKLKDALGKCGAAGCSPEFLAKVHVALGTVQGVGLSKTDEAKESFVAALKADPGAALDPGLTTPELTKLFNEAKKEAGGAPGPKKGPKKEPAGGDKPPAGDAQHTPPGDALVNAPLPIYVEPSEEIALTKVTLWFKPFGAKTYKNVPMKKRGSGYGAEIGCEDTGTTGDIKYFFAFTGEGDVAAGSLGSREAPFKVSVKNEVDDRPHFPGAKAPAICQERASCPPGFSGPDCKTGTGDGKDSGGTCEVNADCKSGLTCQSGTCQGDTSSGGKRNLISLGVQLNLMVIKGGSQVCDGLDNSYECFLQGTSHQYFGKTVAKTNTDGIQGGLSLPSITILAGYDRQLLQNLGLQLGVRLGVTIGGSPSPDNLQSNGAPPVATNIAPAKSFLPFFGELRLGYHFGEGVLEKLGFRPYLFVAGGLAQINGAVPVVVCDSRLAAGEAAQKGCSSPTVPAIGRAVDAYQITGLNFVGFGAGTTFGFTNNFGIAVEAKAMFLLPTFGVVIAPTISPVVAF